MRKYFRMKTVNKNQHTILYVVRHGETDWNAKGLIQGHTDVPLNEEGKKQALDLARELKEIGFRAIFASDLKRAQETAVIIARLHKKSVITTHLLRERTFGPFEGRSKEEIFQVEELLNDPQKRKKYGEEHDFYPENDQAITDRFFEFSSDVHKTHRGKTILAVTHGGVIRGLLKHLGTKSKTGYYYAIRNTSYLKLLFNGSKFVLEEMKGIETNASY